MSEFKYLECILGESGMYIAECHRKVASEKIVVGVNSSLVNTSSLRLSVRGCCMKWCMAGRQ